MSVVHDGHQSQPSLLGGGNDLIGGQQEAVEAGVSQLEGVGVLHSLVVSPVNGATAGLVCSQNSISLSLLDNTSNIGFSTMHDFKVLQTLDSDVVS